MKINLDLNIDPIELMKSMHYLDQLFIEEYNRGDDELYQNLKYLDELAIQIRSAHLKEVKKLLDTNRKERLLLDEL